MSNGWREADDIAKVVSYFDGRSLSAERYSGEHQGDEPTPDLEVKRDGASVAYCEVKSPGQDAWLEEQLERAEPGEIVGGARPDPTFNRLAAHVCKAAKQFETVNPDRGVPNVLALVNHDNVTSAHDLRETLTGNFLAEDGTEYPTMRRVSEGRVRDAKTKVDLYLWISADTDRVQKLPVTDSPHAEAIRTMFDL